MKNVPALKVSWQEQEQCLSGQYEPLLQKIRWFLQQSESDRLILALPGASNPEYKELKTLAHSLCKAADGALPEGAPVLIVLEQDIGKALGILMEKELSGRRRVACIDGIKVEQGDYVDLGRPMLNGLVIPVVVKTLLFG